MQVEDKKQIFSMVLLFLMGVNLWSIGNYVYVAKCDYDYTYLEYQIDTGVDDALVYNGEFYDDLEDNFIRSSSSSIKLGLRWDNIVIPDNVVIDDVKISLYLGTYNTIYNNGEEEISVRVISDEISGFTVVSDMDDVYPYPAKFGGEDMEIGWNNITISSSNPMLYWDSYATGFVDDYDSFSVVVSCPETLPAYTVYTSVRSYEYSGGTYAPKLYIKYHVSTTPVALYDLYGDDVDYYGDYEGYDVYVAQGANYEDFRTYTEVDPDSDMTISSDGLTCTMTDHLYAESGTYLFKENASSAFSDGDYLYFSHTLSYSESGSDYGHLMQGFKLSDQSGDSISTQSKGQVGSYYLAFWYTAGGYPMYSPDCAEATTYWHRLNFISGDDWYVARYLTEQDAIDEVNDVKDYSLPNHVNFDESDYMDVTLNYDIMATATYVIDSSIISHLYISANTYGDTYYALDEDGDIVANCSTYDCLVQNIIDLGLPSEIFYVVHFMDIIGTVALVFHIYSYYMFGTGISGRDEGSIGIAMIIWMFSIALLMGWLM